MVLHHPSSRGASRSATIKCAILVLGWALLLIRIEWPPQMVFDEAAYISAARALLAHSPTTNPEHPPLGKYLIAGGISLFGDNPLGWRSASALFGGLALLGIFWWCERLLQDASLALLATVLTACNGFWFVLARTAMLEIFLFTFGIWAVLAFTATVMSEHSRAVSQLLLFASGTLFGLALGCKWNALVGLLIVQTVTVVVLARGECRSYGRNLLKAGLPWTLCSLFLLPPCVYLLTYIPLYLSTGERFTAANIVAMHAWMWNYHRHAAGNPAIATPWYKWIFRTEPQRALDYLLGNFAVAWGGIVALGICTYRLSKRIIFAESLLTMLYAGNLLVWAIAPRTFTYYYYYFSAIMFLGPMIAASLRGVRPVFGVRPALVVTLCAMIIFLASYPAIIGLDARWACALGCHD